MSAPKKVFGIILAGGEGKRLMPLTMDRAKPAVPFGGQYRLIDFAISNLINSGLRQVVVLTQYKSHSLDRHVSQNWRMSGLLDSYVASVPAQQRLGKRWFSGSADAILQSLNLINDEKPDIVVVIGADHVYRMDFQQMVDAHIASGASATVAGIRQPLALASQFGVIDADPETGRIREFLEKPSDPAGLADSPGEVLVSMGNYVFDTDALIAAVEADGESASSGHDMGGDIVPYFVGRGEAGYYDMKQNDVPGSSPRDRSYWRDVGTIDSYFDAHMDLISTLPIFNLYNTAWPIRTQTVNTPPAKFVRDAVGRIGNAIDSIVSAGSVLSGTHLERSVVGVGTLASGGSTITDSVLLDGVQLGLGARVHRAVLDKNVILEDGATVGVDRERDLERGFTVTDSGITVVGKGIRIAR
ncbi:glucose-1-phosphate adenylyltransferase [Microbacterium sp.]|uniref:glucose-1-phosphate adenylyltransferase n=1 Tax=Microbacterium sp. TaxID=51671 RepID=UPI003A952551